jgi:hypothetical protein
MPWKVERFNRLIEADVAMAAKSIAPAEIVVGIPFHRETENIGRLLQTICADLEAYGERAAIVIVSEHKTKHLLVEAPLPQSTELVTITAFAKPFGFGQKPGLSRRSWSQWAVLQAANRVHADVVFIDADVRNAQGWLHHYLDAIRNRGASVAVANYVREFGTDDALVHVWDSIIFGALFKTWIAFRHGGDYALSRTLVPEVLRDPTIMRERAYTMDSAVMRLAAQNGARIESVWLGEKIHTPINPQNLFNRLPHLVESVFDDVTAHLPVLLKLRHQRLVPEPNRASGISRPMGELIGEEFRIALACDQAARFQNVQRDLRRLLGSIAFKRFSAASASPAALVHVSPADWASATVRLLRRYLRSRDQARKTALAKAYVPVLQLGILGFLNRTYSMRYDQALRLLDQEYLPVFQQAWNALAGRISFPQFSFLRRWPVRVRRRITSVVRRLVLP